MWLDWAIDCWVATPRSLTLSLLCEWVNASGAQMRRLSSRWRTLINSKLKSEKRRTASTWSRHKRINENWKKKLFTFVRYFPLPSSSSSSSSVFMSVSPTITHIYTHIRRAALHFALMRSRLPKEISTFPSIHLRSLPDRRTRSLRAARVQLTSLKINVI